MDVSVFSPAKLNLFLAVTGRRADGFHDLVSLVTPLAWGDDLEAQLAENRGGVFAGGNVKGQDQVAGHRDITNGHEWAANQREKSPGVLG